jgi:putative ABC transport system substrate-binding protein
VKRREFITLLGGVAVARPLAVEAQQSGPTRRIGVLMNLTADDPMTPVRVTAFAQGLQELGWIAGRNVRIDYRWGAGDPDLFRKYATELVALGPDVIVGSTTSIVRELQRATPALPIVFVGVIDPVGGGLVASLARPGGNATGFALFEYGMSGKWLELLKEIAPRITRVAVIRDPTATGGSGQLAAIQVVAPSFGVELSPVDTRDADGIERAVSALARETNAGLIVTGSTSALAHRELIINLVARYPLPAIYPFRPFVAGGGLAYYGADSADQFRRAAGYVDRILKGEKPADLPVQAPTKFELVINLKTAKTLGLEIPATVLARADEVIE